MKGRTLFVFQEWLSRKAYIRISLSLFLILSAFLSLSFLSFIFFFALSGNIKYYTIACEFQFIIQNIAVVASSDCTQMQRLHSKHFAT